MKGPDGGARLGQAGLHPKDRAFQGILTEFLKNLQTGSDLSGNRDGKIGVGTVDAPIDPPGAKLPLRLPDILTPGDGYFYGKHLLPGGANR